MELNINSPKYYKDVYLSLIHIQMCIRDRSYYHRDEQLSTALVTDGHRNVQNSYQYDAFGMSLGTTEKLNNRIRYTGQQYDDVTGQ